MILKLNILASKLKILILLLLSITLLNCNQNKHINEIIKELKPVATLKIPSIEINFTNPRMVGFSKQGIVVIDKDMSRLICYQNDGEIAWEKTPPEKYISSIYVSQDGSTITAYYPMNEVEGVTEVMNSDGEMLWRQKLDGAFIPSHTGKYLFSEASMIDVPPLTVIETTTGKVLWKKKSDEFQAMLLDEENIVHVIRGEMSVIEMSTGSILATHEMKNHFEDDLSHTDWMISVSEDGNYFAVLGKSAQSKKDLIQSFNRNSELHWTKTLDHGGYSKLAGLSEDGSRLLLTRGIDTRLYDNLTGDLLWKIEENILNNGALVTNEFISIKQLPYQSEVFALGDNGSLIKRFSTNAILTKSTLPKIGDLKGAFNLMKQRKSLIVEIKKEDQHNLITFYDKVAN